MFFDMQECYAKNKNFFILAGGENMHVVGTTLHRTKRNLYDYNTSISVSVKARELKNGAIKYIVNTTWVDVDGHDNVLKSAAIYGDSSVYHTICEHIRSIIA